MKFKFEIGDIIHSNVSQMDYKILSMSTMTYRLEVIAKNTYQGVSIIGDKMSYGYKVMEKNCRLVKELTADEFNKQEIQKV